jgi:hypothetical protein
MNVSENVAAYQEVRDTLTNTIKVGGNTFKEWYPIFFNFKIPEDLDPNNCKVFGRQLMKLNQTAMSFATAANMRKTALDGIASSAYLQKMSELSENAKREDKKIAAAILESMAKVQIDQTTMMQTFSEIEKTFWKDVLAHLAIQRKHLEGITMNNALLLKIEGAVGSLGGSEE